MSASLPSPADAEPNLTPMLDMVFQLVTFFMLVINFKSSALDLNLKLPVVGSVGMIDAAARDLIVLNLTARGVLRAGGSDQADADAYLRREAATSLQAANNAASGGLQSGAELPSIVVIRADEQTPFHPLGELIRTCQELGFRNFALKAARERPPDDRGKTPLPKTRTTGGELP